MYIRLAYFGLWGYNLVIVGIEHFYHFPLNLIKETAPQLIELKKDVALVQVPPGSAHAHALSLTIPCLLALKMKIFVFHGSCRICFESNPNRFDHHSFWWRNMYNSHIAYTQLTKMKYWPMVILDVLTFLHSTSSGYYVLNGLDI